MTQVPAVCRIVRYKLSAHDADVINRQRAATAQSRSAGTTLLGVQTHAGNVVEAGDVYPMVITRVWSSQLVNGQVLLDGNDTHWVTSVKCGDGEREYAWPTAVPSRTKPGTRPAIGRWVHYVARGSADGAFAPACRAAMVTEVDDNGDLVGLLVANPTGLFFHPLAAGGCAHHAGDVGPTHNGDTITDLSYPGGTWHWPDHAA